MQRLVEARPADSQHEELDALKREVDWLQEKLEVITRRLRDMEPRENDVKEDS